MGPTMPAPGGRGFVRNHRGRQETAYFLSLSSTSTNSASTTLSLPFCSPPPEEGPPSPGGGPPAGCDVLLYMASASLWLAVVRRSTVELMRSGSLSAMAFLVSSRADSISLASASPTLLRCSLRVFSTLYTMRSEEHT